MFASQGLLIFSSEDTRRGGGIAASYSVPWDRLRFRSHEGELIGEGYVARTHSDGIGPTPANDVTAYGVLAMARYRGRSRGGSAGYFELGWGFQYAEQRTQDLDNRFNSTPTVGIGVVTSGAGRELSFGLRLMHVSNGGLTKGNAGQNNLMLTGATKF